MSMGPGVVTVAPEVEVLAKAERRRFTAEYKRKILKEADACTKPGELGALLRREGLYSSLLATWRAASRRGELSGLRPQRRGPKGKTRDVRDKRIAELERENRRLKRRAARRIGIMGAWRPRGQTRRGAPAGSA